MIERLLLGMLVEAAESAIVQDRLYVGAARHVATIRSYILADLTIGFAVKLARGHYVHLPAQA